MDKDLFGKLDTTDKKDIDVLEKLMKEKRNKENTTKDTREPVSA